MYKGQTREMLWKSEETQFADQIKCGINRGKNGTYIPRGGVVNEVPEKAGNPQGGGEASSV